MFKKLIVLTIFLLLTLSCSGPTETTEQASLLYWNETPPEGTRKIFKPGIVSTNYSNGCAAMMDGGKLCVFTHGDSGTFFSYLKGTEWTEPVPAPWENDGGYTDYTSGPDGKTIYLQTRRSRGEDYPTSTDTWKSVWQGDGNWTEPEPMPDAVLSDQSEGYPSVCDNGDFYFFSSRGNTLANMYRHLLVNGEYQPVEKLPYPLNTKYHEIDPVISPRGNYIIFGSGRPGGYRSSCFYVSFVKEDGSFTNPVVFPEDLFAGAAPVRATFTEDGKYLFFPVLAKQDPSKGEIVSNDWVERYGTTDTYWIDLEFIEDLKEKADKKPLGLAFIQAYKNDGPEASIEFLSNNLNDQEFNLEVSELMMFCDDLVRGGKLEEATSLKNSLLEIGIHNRAVKWGYICALSFNGHMDAAMEELQAFINEFKYPDEAHLFGLLEYQTQQLAGPEHEFVIYEFKQKVYPDYHYNYLDMGNSYIASGDKQKGIEMALKFLELKPDYSNKERLLEYVKSLEDEIKSEK